MECRDVSESNLNLVYGSYIFDVGVGMLYVGESEEAWGEGLLILCINIL